MGRSQPFRPGGQPGTCESLRRLRGVPLCLTVLAWACGSGEGAPAVAERQVVDGEERWFYAAAPANPLTWAFDTLAVIGDVFPESDAYQFDQVVRAGLAGDAAGNLYLLDRAGRRVLAFSPDGEHRAGALILAVGAWLTEVMGAGPGLPLDVTQQVVHWFAKGQGSEGGGEPDGVPVTIWEYAPDRFFYTVPEAEGGAMKAALHYGGEAVRPDEVDRTVDPDEARELRGLLERYLPGSADTLLESSACLYTSTPDHAFVLGRHPDANRVVVLGGGSGHAFKFAPALGEAAAELVLGEQPFVDLGPFSPARFGG
jgi:hypothetical protein